VAGFQRASKSSARLRMALIGPAGSGKTYTALNIAQHLGGPIAVLDTEHGSASKYADRFEFDTMEPSNFNPQVYIDAIHEAERAGYKLMIIDSLSHAWMGRGGALELVDQAAKRSKSGNSFTAWREVTPLHNQLVETMLAANLHLIVTMRSKTEYVVEQDDKGKTSIRKVGLQPVQRDGLEYEFDVIADLDQDNNFVVGKTRCPEIAGLVVQRAGKEVADVLVKWLTDGTPLPAPEPPPILITDSQRLDMFALAEEVGVTGEQLGKHVQISYGHNSSKEITAPEYDAIISWLNNQRVMAQPLQD